VITVPGIYIYDIMFRQDTGKHDLDVDVIESIRETAIKIQAILRTEIEFLEMNGDHAHLSSGLQYALITYSREIERMMGIASRQPRIPRARTALRNREIFSG
jgi:hypothetical protein